MNAVRWLVSMVDDLGAGALRVERHRDPHRAVARADRAAARFSYVELHQLDDAGRWRLVADWSELGPEG
ncbi:MAG: hypothetical protein M3Q10_18340 [Chloroflexota bacterium]|nr:hypothetical protein [Chloroflexota bacterium]